MNIDFIEAFAYVDKSKLYLDDLAYISTNVHGWDNYTLSFNKEIKVSYNSNSNQLKVSGSIPYFKDGQNFHNDSNSFQEGIQIISDNIDYNLFNASVDLFENGITFLSPLDLELVFNSHHSIPGAITTTYGKTGKLYKGQLKHTRLYDAGRNIKKKVSKDVRKWLTVNKGYDPSEKYIRFEDIYINPVKSFGKEIYVKDLFNTDFRTILNKDLLSSYSKIIKHGGNFSYPSEPREFLLEVRASHLPCRKSGSPCQSQPNCIHPLTLTS